MIWFVLVYMYLQNNVSRRYHFVEHLMPGALHVACGCMFSQGENMFSLLFSLHKLFTLSIPLH